MQDFRRLRVYQDARALNKELFELMRNPNFDRTLRDQLGRASVSIMLNIAEGATRLTKPDRRKFFIIARSSAMECSAIMDIVEDFGLLKNAEAEAFRLRFDHISKMLFSLVRHLESESPSPS